MLRSSTTTPGEQRARLPPSRQNLLLSLFAPTLQAVKIGDEDESVRGRESGNVLVAELVASLLQAMVVELGDQAGAKREGRGGVAAHGRAMVWPGA